MNTKILMTGSALILGAAGLAGTFAPQEILEATGMSAPPLLVQLLAALLLGFAIANWTAKDSRIGGIYNRPLALGNLMHFVVGAFTLVRVAIGHATVGGVVAAVVYAAFAICFGLVVFGR